MYNPILPPPTLSLPELALPQMCHKACLHLDRSQLGWHKACGGSAEPYPDPIPASIGQCAPGSMRGERRWWEGGSEVGIAHLWAGRVD